MSSTPAHLINIRWLKMTPSRSDLIELARKAGSLLREGYGKQHAIDHKGRIDLVTEMDRKSEAFLIQEIQAKFPGHSIYSEESGRLSGQDHSCWYIDPLDGTTNYAHNIPFFTVSIAYAEAGEMRLGAVYDPMRDECFSAERGKGAWLNENPIRVSKTHEMLDSLLVTGFPYEGESLRNLNLKNFAHFTNLSQGVRRLGSAALDLCYVASGRVDGYWELSLRAYDLAAGALIVEEAGGVVTSIRGEADYLKMPFSILAGNPTIHRLMLAEFQHLL